MASYPPASTPPMEFLGARFDAGLAWVHFDLGVGGLGVPAALQTFVDQRMEAAGAFDPTGTYPSPSYVGRHQAATVVHALGSGDQRRRWLRSAFTTEEYWCQLYSEPGAGSDLAALGTSAVRDGDEWLVNGQKVWTSFAHLARWAILLARTDPNVPKHRGLTLFVVDMRDPGVDVRPLLTMDGGRHFNEVFLTDVGVPDEHRLGDVGHGWNLSQSLLASEREGVADHESSWPWLLQAWRNRRAVGEAADAVYRDRVVSAYVAAEVSRLMALRSREAQGREGATTYAPVVKVLRNAADMQIANLIVDLLGPEGTLGGEYGWETRGEHPNDHMRFLRSRGMSIAGGTSQVIRNIIGERVLGLPGEPRVDKDLPWRQVGRS